MAEREDNIRAAIERYRRMRYRMVVAAQLYIEYVDRPCSQGEAVRQDNIKAALGNLREAVADYKSTITTYGSELMEYAESSATPRG